MTKVIRQAYAEVDEVLKYLQETILVKIENNAKDIISLLNGRLYNTDNLLLNAYIVNGKYYTYGEEHSSASISYAIIPMKSDKTYVLSAARFIALVNDLAEGMETPYKSGPCSKAPRIAQCKMYRYLTK
jgi:hypothetical protein